MEKEYLWIEKVVADKGELSGHGSVRVSFVDEKKGEGTSWIHPSRLIDPEDLSIGLPQKGDEYFYHQAGIWQVADVNHNKPGDEPFLIRRKPKPDRWQELLDRCPVQFHAKRSVVVMAKWVREVIEFKMED